MLAQCLDSTDFWSQNIEIYFWIIVVLPFAVCWWNNQRLNEVNHENMNKNEMLPLEGLQTQKLAKIELNRDKPIIISHKK